MKFFVLRFIATFSRERKVSESLEDGTVVPHLETDAIFGLLERAQQIDPVDAERRLGIPRDCKMFFNLWPFSLGAIHI